MKLKLTYTSGIKPETVDIGDQVPSEYIAARFGGGTINALVQNGGSYAIVEEAPIQSLEEAIAPPVEVIEPVVEEVTPVTAPFTVETAVDHEDA